MSVLSMPPISAPLGAPFAALLMALLAAGCNGRPPVVETGHVDAAHPLMQPRLRDEESFAETWSAMAVLDDGGYVQAQLGVSNVGPGSERGICRLLYAPQGQTPWTANTKVDREAWRVSPEGALIIGTCQGEVSDRALRLSGTVGEAQFSLTLSERPRRIEPPGHHIELDDDFYTSTLLIPWAPAKVSLTLPSGATVEATGRGYADHSRATALPGDLARQWVRVRRLTPGQGMLALLRYPADAEQPPEGWIWREGEDKPRAITESGLDSLGPINADRAWRLRLGQDPSTDAGSLIYRAAPVEDQGMLAPFIEAVIGNPVTYTYAVPGGVMEVTIVDE